jgi:hypothetical protein
MHETRFFLPSFLSEWWHMMEHIPVTSKYLHGLGENE